jgi:hypothetical protein
MLGDVSLVGALTPAANCFKRSAPSVIDLSAASAFPRALIMAIFPLSVAVSAANETATYRFTPI